MSVLSLLHLLLGFSLQIPLPDQGQSTPVVVPHEEDTNLHHLPLDFREERYPCQLMLLRLHKSKFGKYIFYLSTFAFWVSIFLPSTIASFGRAQENSTMYKYIGHQIKGDLLNFGGYSTLPNIRHGPNSRHGTIFLGNSIKNMDQIKGFY